MLNKCFLITFLLKNNQIQAWTYKYTHRTGWPWKPLRDISDCGDWHPKAALTVMGLDLTWVYKPLDLSCVPEVGTVSEGSLSEHLISAPSLTWKETRGEIIRDGSCHIRNWVRNVSLLGRYHLIQKPGHLLGVVPLFQHSHRVSTKPLPAAPRPAPLLWSLSPQPKFRLHHFFLKYGCILQHRCCWPVGFLLSFLNPFRGLFFSQHKKSLLCPNSQWKQEFLSVLIIVFPEPITLRSRSSVNACWLNKHVPTLS